VIFPGERERFRQPPPWTIGRVLRPGYPPPSCGYHAVATRGLQLRADLNLQALNPQPQPHARAHVRTGAIYWPRSFSSFCWTTTGSVSASAAAFRPQTLESSHTLSRAHFILLDCMVTRSVQLRTDLQHLKISHITFRSHPRSFAGHGACKGRKHTHTRPKKTFGRSSSFWTAWRRGAFRCAANSRPRRSASSTSGFSPAAFAQVFYEKTIETFLAMMFATRIL